MRLILLGLPLVLTGCPDDKDGTGPADTDSADVRVFEDFVNTTDAYVAGDMTCWTAGALTTQTPEPSCQQTLTLTGVVQDFQTEDPVADATVQVWANDDLTSAPSSVTAADADGNFTVEAPSCTPFGYGTSTPVEWQETKDTYEVHQVYGYSESGNDTAIFNSVSEATSAIIPGLIGVPWDESKGIIAGAAYDCNGDAITSGQVYIHDANGNIPATGDVFYFANSLPTGREQQPDTNDDGLWVALNVPAGTWIVELYGYNGATYDMLGSTQLQINAGSVNISNIYAGISDGKAYPDSCMTPCGG